MKKNLVKIVNLALVLGSFIVGLWAYSRLPERVASHWNINGDVDGYTSRFGGAFFIPFMILGLYLLFLFIPKIDPKKENREAIMPIFDKFVTIFLLFMLYLYSLTIAFALGRDFDMTQALLPAFGLLFYYIGRMLPQAKPNWFLGIRTPWTLSNNEVWTKTHTLGGNLFKISGILSLLGAFFPRYGFFLVIGPILIFTVYLFIYSYLEYKKLEK